MSPSTLQPDPEPDRDAQAHVVTESASGPARPFSGRTVAGMGALAAAVIGKSKGALLLLKGLPLSKVLISGGSMFVSMVLYAAHGGVAYGVGFVLLILVHELGHGYAMKRAGVGAGWPVFIPFFGAMIAMKGQPSHPRIEAEIAYAGPIAGTAASLACAAIALVTHSRLFLVLGYLGFMLNLFNLIPFGFLDGGRVARVVSRKAWIVGALLIGALMFASPSPQLLMILVFGGMHALRAQADPALDVVTSDDRSTWSYRYFGLCAFLAACVFFSNRIMKLHGG